jgi:uncharacterized protein (DUF433 family)
MRATTATVTAGHIVLDVSEYSEGTPVKVFILPERSPEEQIDELAYMLLGTGADIDQAESTINTVRSLARDSPDMKTLLKLGSVSGGRVTIQVPDIAEGTPLIIVLTDDLPIQLSPDEIEELERRSDENQANPEGQIDAEEFLRKLGVELNQPRVRFTAAQLFRRFSRITRDPKVLDGKPCIRGLPISVGMIVGPLREGADPSELLKQYPSLQPEDIEEALEYGRAGNYVDGEGIEEFPPC